MQSVFIALAIIVGVTVFSIVGLAPHAAATHWFTLLWLVAVVAALPFAWRWFAAYQVTASVAARIDAAEGKVWTQIKLRLEGAWSAMLFMASSAFFTVGDWISSTFHSLTGLDPSALDPFKDVTLLHNFFSDTVVPKIAAGVAFFAALLHIKASMTAAAIVPAPGTAAPAVAAPAAPVAPATPTAS